MTGFSCMFKRSLRVLLATLLALSIVAASLLFLAHSHHAGAPSFSPSLIYGLCGENKQDAQLASKIEEELSELFEGKIGD